MSSAASIAKQAALKALQQAKQAAADAIPIIRAIPGKPILNVNIFKSQPDPIAQSLDKYPPWLAKEVEFANTEHDPEAFIAENRPPTRREMRLLNKRKIKEMNLEKSNS